MWQGFLPKESSNVASETTYGTETQYTTSKCPKKGFKSIKSDVFLLLQQLQQVQQNEVIVSQGGQGQIQQNGHQQGQLRNVVINNQQMQVQVLPDNTQQVIKYEIIQHEGRSSIE